MYFKKYPGKHLELNHLSLAFSFTSQLEMLGSLDGSLKQTVISRYITIYANYLVFPLALSTLQLEDQLLGGLGLLSQDGFGLTSESLLFTVISEIGQNQSSDYFVNAFGFTSSFPEPAWTRLTSCTGSP